MKISVIVPVYKVEKYLRQCLESIAGQTYDDLEIIPVDDGSPDNCGKIIDEFAAIDSRIKAIHQANGGYGRAVNAGLDASTGDYIAIVESDDYIEFDMFTRLAAGAIGQYEIVKSGFTRIMDEKPVTTVTLDKLIAKYGEVITPADAHCDSLYLFESSIWSALYRRDFLLQHKIRMIETQGAAYQDSIFKFMVYANCQKMRLLPGTVYNYRVMAQGSSSANNKRALVMFGNYRLLEEYFEENNLQEKMFRIVSFHKIFDFVFHCNRLSGSARQSFVLCAAQELRRIQEHGVDLSSLDCDNDTRDYWVRTVLPLAQKIEQKGRRKFELEKLLAEWKTPRNYANAFFSIVKFGLCIITGVFSVIFWLPAHLFSYCFARMAERSLSQLEERLKREQLERFYAVHRLIEDINDQYVREFSNIRRAVSSQDPHVTNVLSAIQTRLKALENTQGLVLALLKNHTAPGSCQIAQEEDES